MVAFIDFSGIENSNNANLVRARANLRTQIASVSPAYSSRTTCGEWLDSSCLSGRREQISA
jgi:hypothetical protein